MLLHTLRSPKLPSRVVVMRDRVFVFLAPPRRRHGRVCLGTATLFPPPFHFLGVRRCAALYPRPMRHHGVVIPDREVLDNAALPFFNDPKVVVLFAFGKQHGIAIVLFDFNDASERS